MVTKHVRKTKFYGVGDSYNLLVYVPFLGDHEVEGAKRSTLVDI